MLLGTGALQIASMVNFVAFARFLDAESFGGLRQLFLINQIIFAVVFSLADIVAVFLWQRTRRGAPERGAATSPNTDFGDFCGNGIAVMALFIVYRNGVGESSPRGLDSAIQCLSCCLLPLQFRPASNDRRIAQHTPIGVLDDSCGDKHDHSGICCVFYRIG